MDGCRPHKVMCVCVCVCGLSTYTICLARFTSFEGKGMVGEQRGLRRMIFPPIPIRQPQNSPTPFIVIIYYLAYVLL